jgi:hypothetical protein
VSALTRVTLSLGSEGVPVWQRDFQIHVDSRDHLDQTSILFAPSGRRYWDSFFVPVATWQSKAAVRSRLTLAKKVGAVDAVGDRAVVLFQDGDFQLIELADPSAPVVLAEHHRPRDFKQWSGVRALGDRIAIFGDDGLEVIRFTKQGSETLTALQRGDIGSVVAIEPFGEGILMAGNRGLMSAQADGSNPMRLLRRSLRGFAVAGDTLIFSDAKSVFLSSIPLLRENRVLAQLRVGPEFGPGRIRVFGNTVVVLGETGVLVLDTTDPRKPRVVSQLRSQHIGKIEDASQVKGRIFLLGDRGLQLLDEQHRRVVDSIDVETRNRIATMGRHMVAIGTQDLQVVDATPFTARSLPAKAEPESTAEPEGG